MLEGELDASSGCLEGPLSVIIEVVEFQAAGCGVQGKFKCSSGDEQTEECKAAPEAGESGAGLDGLAQLVDPL